MDLCMCRNNSLMKYFMLSISTIITRDARAKPVKCRHTLLDFCHLCIIKFGSVVVKALCYKHEGRGLVTR
jgi:hypothetical protein